MLRYTLGDQLSSCCDGDLGIRLARLSLRVQNSLLASRRGLLAQLPWYRRGTLTLAQVGPARVSGLSVARPSHIMIKKIGMAAMLCDTVFWLPPVASYYKYVMSRLELQWTRGPLTLFRAVPYEIYYGRRLGTWSDPGHLQP